MQVAKKRSFLGSTLTTTLSPVKVPDPGEYTIFVDCNATGNNDGTSWEDAFTTLRQAVDAAVSGSLIGVRPGTYDGFEVSQSISYEIRSTDGAEKTFIRGTGTTSSILQLGTTYTSRIWVNGFKFIGSATTRVGKYFCIKNCVVDGNYITLTNSEFKPHIEGAMYYENVDLMNFSGDCSAMPEAFSVQLKNCRLMNFVCSGNNNNHICNFGHGAAGEPSENYYMENCLFYNCWQSAASDSQAAFIQPWGRPVYNCTFIAAEGCLGKFLGRSTDDRFYNCIFYIPTTMDISWNSTKETLNNCYVNRDPSAGAQGTWTVDSTIDSSFMIPPKSSAMATSGNSSLLKSQTDIVGKAWKSSPSVGCYQV